jgi:hypothetical protein
MTTFFVYNLYAEGRSASGGLYVIHRSLDHARIGSTSDVRTLPTEHRLQRCASYQHLHDRHGLSFLKELDRRPSLSRGEVRKHCEGPTLLSGSTAEWK